MSDPTLEKFRYRIFVYGTLRPGGFYYQKICPGYELTHIPAWTRGKLFHLPLGYPAMAKGDEKVQGDLLCFNSPQLKQALDQLEGYDPARKPEYNEYNLEQITAWLSSGETLDNVYAYFMDPEKIRKSGGIHLSKGVWIDRR
jgi:gamma-glutamylcyclotransferase (GGCT)/AIG2-like uncharacterized protein YtfP